MYTRQEMKTRGSDYGSAQDSR